MENFRKIFYNFPISHRCENGLQEITRVYPIPISDFAKITKITDHKNVFKDRHQNSRLILGESEQIN